MRAHCSGPHVRCFLAFLSSYCGSESFPPHLLLQVSVALPSVSASLLQQGELLQRLLAAQQAAADGAAAAAAAAVERRWEELRQLHFEQQAQQLAEQLRLQFQQQQQSMALLLPSPVMALQRREQRLQAVPAAAAGAGSMDAGVQTSPSVVPVRACACMSVRAWWTSIER